MPRPSTIKRLPPQVRDKIGALLDQGRTLDEIMERLDAMDVQVSRSALGRYKQQIDKVSERIRRSREIAEAVVRNLGEEPESKTTRLNIELLHGVLNDIMQRVPQPGEVAGDIENPLDLKPMDAMLLAKAVDHLAKARRNDADLIAKLKEQARTEAREEMAKRVAGLGTAADLKSLSDEELNQRIAALAGE